MCIRDSGYFGEFPGSLAAFGRLRSGRFVFVSLVKEGARMEVWGLASSSDPPPPNEFQRLEFLRAVTLGGLRHRPRVTARLHLDVVALGVGKRPRDVALVDVAEGVVRRRFPLGETMGNLALSADADALFVADYRNRLRAFDVASGEALWTVSAGEPDWNYAWFEMPLLLAGDARHLAAGLMTAEVYVVDTLRGRVVRRFELRDPESPVHQLAWLRRGSALAARGELVKVFPMDWAAP